MRIVVAGTDLTEELMPRIKKALLQHLALLNLLPQEFSMVRIPEDWKGEYKSTKENLFTKIKLFTFFEKFGPDISLLPDSMTANRLLSCNSEYEFLSLYLTMMRNREHTDTLPFYIPHKKSVVSNLLQKIKILSWKFLKFMVDRITFRQNLINSYLSSAIEFEHKFAEEEIRKLNEKIKQLEEKIKEKQ